MGGEGRNRPVLAAQEKGPGSGRYSLPTCVGHRGHDPTKKCMPHYSFGKRLENPMFRKDCSPGPGYYIDSATTRFGTGGTPSYSILGRQMDPKVFKTPSPGAYYPEKVHPQGEKHAPAYSMSARTRNPKKDNTPSPNSYQLPSLLGSKVPNKRSSAAYSMAYRSSTGAFSEDLAKTPGPGHYNAVAPNVYVKKAPVYSMLSRSYMPGDSTKKPGPGAYSPEKVSCNKMSSPKYSLGIRHSEYVYTPHFAEVQD
ncbi:Outer dense fiber protein 3 [Geodia barretti]|uniref:Outer dense fiber protein 3 n=1 Tax=Geodia barretti TaxID=519541 RepID=A0AA35SFH7_GEOBA|nr:Outer dense fiber protein 3 [Geodia barretti]